VPYSYPKGAPKVFAPFDRSRRPVSLANIRASQVTALPQSHVRCLIVSRLALGITQDEHCSFLWRDSCSRARTRSQQLFLCVVKISRARTIDDSRDERCKNAAPAQAGAEGGKRPNRTPDKWLYCLALNADYPRL